MNEANYLALIEAFLEAGYHFGDFQSAPPPERTILLRHDVDFDVGCAYRMSQLEDQLGIRANYFFLLQSHSYNLLEPENLEQVRSIADRGHEVSLHFDASIHADIEAGFAFERAVFEQSLEVEIRIISLHRPADGFLSNPDDFSGVGHTYQPRFIQDIAYFSDSQGRFRYGHPLDSTSFADKASLQFLIHPIWWMADGDSSMSKLEGLVTNRERRMREHVAANCMPYREYLDEKP